MNKRKYNNTVIHSTNKDIGDMISLFYNAMGFYFPYNGSLNSSDGNIKCYYGISNGIAGVFTLNQVKAHNLKIIDLPERLK